MLFLRTISQKNPFLKEFLVFMKIIFQRFLEDLNPGPNY